MAQLSPHAGGLHGSFGARVAALVGWCLLASPPGTHAGLWGCGGAGGPRGAWGRSGRAYHLTRHSRRRATAGIVWSAEVSLVWPAPHRGR